MVAVQVCKQCVNKQAQRETGTYPFRRLTEGPLIPRVVQKQVVTRSKKSMHPDLIIMQIGSESKKEMNRSYGAPKLSEMPLGPFLLFSWFA